MLQGSRGIGSRTVGSRTESVEYPHPVILYYIFICCPETCRRIRASLVPEEPPPSLDRWFSSDLNASSPEGDLVCSLQGPWDQQSNIIHDVTIERNDCAMQFKVCPTVLPLPSLALECKRALLTSEQYDTCLGQENGWAYPILSIHCPTV